MLLAVGVLVRTCVTMTVIYFVTLGILENEHNCLTDQHNFPVSSVQTT